MSSICKGKSSWPELVGVDGCKAKAIIEKENPFVTAVIIGPEVSAGTADFRCNRVRVLVNKDNIVTRVPFIG